MTTFGDQVFQFGGVPTFGYGGLIPVPGNVYWVHPASSAVSDGNPQAGGPSRPRATVSSVQSSMTANQNDTVFLIGNSSASSGNVVSESAEIAWSKSLTHIMGTGFNRVSHRSSIRASATDVTITMTQSGDGCVFANFHMTNQATANTSRCLVITGQRNAYYNLHLAAGFNQTGADQNALTDVLMPVNGNGELYFKDCTIGLDTTDRASTGSNVFFTSGTPTTRNEFDNCRFIHRADTAATFLPISAGSQSIDRYLILKDCLFINSGDFTGGNVTSQALSVHAFLGGMIFLINTLCIGFTKVETTSSTNVIIQQAYAAGTTALALVNTA